MKFANPFSSKEKVVISQVEHKKIVNTLLKAIIEMNVLIAEWTISSTELAEKSKNQEVIKFANNSMLVLKKKLAEKLQNLPKDI